ncbi:hypothetical protein T01_5256 [Trichinella spiralis]|uniref:Uncharacterized protein n=1 Tax=Trichinella spiralis TaxID=6334 RepID=A0A0V1BAL2_TRISP|nr:hypothetical protein T01_5256 [Trichinella spiralis]
MLISACPVLTYSHQLFNALSCNYNALHDILVILWLLHIFFYMNGSGFTLIFDVLALGILMDFVVL